METNGTAEENRSQIEERASRATMALLTGGLTDQGDTFLIGAAAVLLLALLYPLVGAWSLLAFPAVFAVAVIARAWLRRHSA